MLYKVLISLYFDVNLHNIGPHTRLITQYFKIINTRIVQPI